eukprot:TRINITY_DN9966_c0_g1_i1.p1 TRINITY_DN9966_c0_g1~~TRINITY_DN9966_c0_g1_i1.p1  ORF type:complete len:311 (+),score=29.46 TRINITY_DN9966_c0_g1_i1:53-985(+)
MLIGTPLLAPLISLRPRELRKQMSVGQSVVELAGGVKVPLFGYGCYQVPPGPQAHKCVRIALETGYRHIDTAAFYRNEADVGTAVREFLEAHRLPRSDVFVTTKLWNDQHGREKCVEACRASNDRLGLGHIDLYLVHSPGPLATREDTWRGMEDCVSLGLARAVGVSNFGIPHLQTLLAYPWRRPEPRYAPQVNQFEVTPFLQRRELVEFCKRNRMAVMGYSPLSKGRPEAFRHPAVMGIASRLGLSAAQVLLRWAVAKEYITIPRSSDVGRITDNIAAASAPLPPAEVAALDDACEMGLVTGWDPTSDP